MLVFWHSSILAFQPFLQPLFLLVLVLFLDKVFDLKHLILQKDYLVSFFLIVFYWFSFNKGLVLTDISNSILICGINGFFINTPFFT